MDEHTQWTRQLEKLFEDSAQVPADRQFMLKGMLAMQEGRLDEATSCFRRAQRKDAPPFDVLATLALGECLRLQGKEGAALKTWREILAVRDASVASRHGAWLGIANMLEARGDSPELQEAQEQLRLLEPQLPRS